MRFGLAIFPANDGRNVPANGSIYSANGLDRPLSRWLGGPEALPEQLLDMDSGA